MWFWNHLEPITSQWQGTGLISWWQKSMWDTETEELSQERDGLNDLGWNNAIHCSVHVCERNPLTTLSLLFHPFTGQKRHSFSWSWKRLNWYNVCQEGCVNRNQLHRERVSVLDLALCPLAVSLAPTLGLMKLDLGRWVLGSKPGRQPFRLLSRPKSAQDHCARCTGSDSPTLA